MAVSSKKLDNFVHVVVTRMLDSMKAKRLLHLIGAYSEGHAGDVAILFHIGYKVAHVTRRIHVIPHPLMVKFCSEFVKK